MHGVDTSHWDIACGPDTCWVSGIETHELAEEFRQCLAEESRLTVDVLWPNSSMPSWAVMVTR